MHSTVACLLRSIRPNTGIIVYRIEGDRLIGRWTVPGADDLASENLTPLDQGTSQTAS